MSDITACGGGYVGSATVLETLLKRVVIVGGPHAQPRKAGEFFKRRAYVRNSKVLTEEAQQSAISFHIQYVLGDRIQHVAGGQTTIGGKRVCERLAGR